MPISKSCSCGCGRTVTRYPSEFHTNTFFDRSCYDQWQRKQGDTTSVCAQCGKEKPLAEFRLKRKETNLRYCYCIECINKNSKEKSHTKHDRFNRSKARANRERGKGFWTLSEVRHTFLLSLPCHYCDGPLGISGSGLDRKDNDKGYHSGNVVPCCKTCNVLKNKHFAYEEMLKLSPVLRQLRKDRQCNN